MAAAPVPFALYPGAASNDPLNFAVDKDVKIFNKAIQGLESKFDLKLENLTVFLESVQDRASIYNWKHILEVPKAGAPATLQNIIDKYGSVTLAECKAHSTTYMAANDRNSQNGVMLYQFLANSLSQETKITMLTQTSDYTIDGKKEGLCFLKVIIAKAHVDTIATVNALRTSISNLDNKVKECRGNIKSYVLNGSKRFS
jgi:hypothetical protein